LESDARKAMTQKRTLTTFDFGMLKSNADPQKFDFSMLKSNGLSGLKFSMCESIAKTDSSKLSNATDSWLLPEPCKHPDKDVARNLMVSYVAGVCSPAGKRNFEDHCLSCEECCSTLAILMRLSHSPIAEEKEEALAQLMESPRKARQGQKRKSRRQSRLDSRVASGRLLQFR
jgi:hypothetical protein